jgi:hypothetical protein
LQQQASTDTTPNTSPNNADKNKMCVINTDNVPNNGSIIRKHMLTLAAEQQDSDKTNDTSRSKLSMQHFFHERVAFLNTMVDGITSQRSKEDAMIPRAEPIPAKALVVLDPDGDLPLWFTSMASTARSSSSDDEKNKCGGGLVIRSTAAQLENDVALKLRIANGTHTSIAHVMALLKVTMTDALSSSRSLSSSPYATKSSTAAIPTSPLLMEYLDSLARDQILVAATAAACVARSTTTTAGDDINDMVLVAQEEAMAVWDDWRRRLTHSHFGLSTFFITQNGPGKVGIRLTPTIVDLIQGIRCSSNKSSDDETTTRIHVSVAFLLYGATTLADTSIVQRGRHRCGTTNTIRGLHWMAAKGIEQPNGKYE